MIRSRSLPEEEIIAEGHDVGIFFQDTEESQVCQHMEINSRTFSFGSK